VKLATRLYASPVFSLKFMQLLPIEEVEELEGMAQKRVGKNIKVF
jgi:hypothetical protein